MPDVSFKSESELDQNTSEASALLKQSVFEGMDL